MRRVLLLIALAGISVLVGAPARAQSPAVHHHADAALIDGFLRTVFGAEFGATAEAAERVKRFTSDVRVYVEVVATPAMTESLARARRMEASAVIRRIAERVPAAAIREVSTGAQANIRLVVTDAENYVRVGRDLLGPNAGFITQNVCSGLITWHSDFSIRRGVAILVGDQGTRLFLSCVAEEFLQMLGPVNDDSTLAYSTFNDANELGGFPVFDQFILNMLYHPRVRPGMTRDEVSAVLPEVLRDVRSRVEREAARRGEVGQVVGGSRSGVVWD